MSVADALRKMAEAGLSLEQAADIIEAMGSEKPPGRSAAAERQAQYRDRLRERGMSATEWRRKSAEILVRDNHTCRYCGAGATQCDHVVPLIADGSNHDTNLVAACGACNGGKSGRTVEEWKGATWAAAWWAHNSDITGDNTGVIAPPCSPPKPPGPPNTPPIIPPPDKKGRARSRRCPPGWEPKPEVIAVGEAEGLTPGEIDRELAMMRDHEFRDPRSDWDATARTWLRKAARNKPSLRLVHAHDRPATPADRRAAREANYARADAGFALAADRLRNGG